MAVVRCKDGDRESINNEVKRCNKYSPFVWTQETMVSIMYKRYRMIDKISAVLKNGNTYGDKVKAIEELVS